MNKIGILGSGPVARSLASGFMELGHTVMMGTRNPEKLSNWIKENGGQVITGSIADAADFGEIIILAVKGTAAKDVLDQAGREHILGKTIIDTTNPIDDVPPDNGVIRFFTKANESLMERLQKEFPGARFVKAFNSIGNDLMVNPEFDTRPTMFVCGDDINSKREVIKILEQFGFEAADMGGAEAARPIESLCILWCIPGFLENDWNHAFRMLKPIPEEPLNKGS